MKRFFVYILMFFISIFVFTFNVSANDLSTNEFDLLTETEMISDEQSRLNADEDIILDENTENLEMVEDINHVEENIDEPKVQLTKVGISKLNIKGELIIGSKLQIIDENGNTLYEWISDGTIYEVMLPAGKYTLHEVEAPEGYELAVDKEFEVEVVIDQEIIGDSNENDHPCNHDNNHTITYFVEIASVSYEVYCINQGLVTPDGIDYDGQILTPDELREFTKQETNIDGEGVTISGTRINVNTITVPDYDVSDQTLTNQELYDKVLDIIYHRHLAEKDETFSDLTEVEIRFITEIALKNYLNARITTYETYRVLNGTTTDHIRYNVDGEVWQTGDGTKYLKLYNKYYNREYVYDPTSPTGYIISEGNGDSFGNYAKHWYGSHGKTIIPEKYAKLYYYLISEENHHPEDMKLYMYSPSSASDDPYQNLLGITGYIEDVETKEQTVKMLSNYNTKKVDIPVIKVWDDENNDSGKRPESIKVNLYANEELIETIELNEENNWSYVFDNLDLYQEGQMIIYTINEVEVKYYETEISGDVNSGFTITNTYEGIGSTLPPKGDGTVSGVIGNPNTGDNVHEVLIVLSFISFGLYVIALFIKNKKLIVRL